MPQTSILPGNFERLRRSVFPSDLDSAFAETALAKGYVTREGLDECRRHHERLRRRGLSLSIGMLLLKRGDLTVEQYLDVLAGREIDTTPSAEPEARFVLGRYRIVRELGRGGMGIVYEARDSALQRRVALKVLKPQDPPSSRALDRFRREAMIGAKLRHPNIVGVHEFGAARDSRGLRVHYLAMDCLEGRTLADLVAQKSESEATLLRILEDVGRAVAFAHRMGVIHRDLKPSNVIVEPSGRAVLTDFGAAQAEDLETRLTTSGEVIGTLAYMAPEQLQGEAGRIDARTDVYALGAMLYEVLAGRPPFQHDSPPRLLQKVLTEAPLPLRRETGAIDPQLELIVLKSMEKDPAKRYAGAGEWVEDLARFRRGEPIEARPRGRTRPWKKALLACAAALLALAAAALVELQRERQRNSGSATSLYERAVLGARLHGRHVDDLAMEDWRDEVDLHAAARIDARAAELRKGMAAALERIVRDPSALAPGQLLCARGLLAWTAGDLPRARKLLAASLERSPLLGEAFEALARLEMDERRYEESIRWSTRGLELDPGSLPHAQNRSFARFLRALELSNRGGSADEEFAAAAADDAASSGVRSGLIQLAWAFHSARSGRDPGDLFAESIHRFDEAVAENQGASKARLWRGAARTLWGLFAAAVPAWSGPGPRDPKALAADAIAEFDALIGRPDAPEAAWMWRGASYFVQGVVQATRLSDPTGSYERALGDLGEAIRRCPARDEALMWRGVVRKGWSIREFLGGRDPRPAYEAALADLDEAIRRNPGRAESWTHRGEARLLWATFAMPSRGEDPSPILSKSILDLDESIRLNPSQGLTWASRGNARLQTSRGSADAKAWAGAALGDYEEALRLNPILACLLSRPIDACLEVLRADSLR